MNIYIQITIASIFGGAAGGLVIYFTKFYFTEKIKAAIKDEYDDKLENLKSELKRNEIAITSALNSQNQGFQIGQKEVLDSIKSFWENYLLLRQTISDFVYMDSYLKEEEFNTLFTDKWTGNNLVPDQLESINFNRHKEIENAGKLIEKLRPFLSANLWLYYSYYQIFCGRMLYLYSQGVLRKRMNHWKTDKPLLRLTKEIFSDKEFENITSASYGSTQAVTKFLEEKILLDISKTLSGHIAAENTYNQAVLLMQLTKEKQP
jgi:hypothetical protein